MDIKYKKDATIHITIFTDYSYFIYFFHHTFIFNFCSILLRNFEKIIKICAFLDTRTK